MKNVCTSILSASDAASQNGQTVDSNQLVSGSFQFLFGDAHAAGTVKLQGSNTPTAQGGPTANLVVNQSWTDIPNASASITAGSSALLLLANMAYRWVRAVYTSTANYKQVNTITTVADVAGSLNSTFFLISSIRDGVQEDFYVWLDNGTGVDPAVPGATGVPVEYDDDDTADTLAGLIRVALAALTDDFVITGATDEIIATNVEPGACDAAADGSDPTGFTFDETNAGVNPTTVTCNMNALSV